MYDYNTLIFYDFEVFKHDWLVVFKRINKNQVIIQNDPKMLQNFYNKYKNQIFVGYNSKHYDQFILKSILVGISPYETSQNIIVGNKKGWECSDKFRNISFLNYDIKTTMHSLKELEAFMGNDIRESSVSFNIDRKLTDVELEDVTKYCIHDVEQTIEVFLRRTEEFDSHISLIDAFKLPISSISNSKAQISATILKSKKKKFKDEFKLDLPEIPTLKKYRHIYDWYCDSNNHDYNKSQIEMVANVEHVFAWGGLHGAIPKYEDYGIFLNMDVASFYPAIMIEYDALSRTVKDTKLYTDIRDERIRLKANKDPKQAPYKIVLNSTYGAMKDKYNALYDPRQANRVCVIGQLLLLDLIESIEDYCQIIQSNTDGILVKLDSMDQYDKVVTLCHEWEERSRMTLEFELYTNVIQKDVNNYIIVDKNGKYKSKGAWVKKLNELDNDLPIVNEAIINYYVKNIPVKKTIYECNDLIKFQKVKKISNKYGHIQHGTSILTEKTIRVFASENGETLKKLNLKTNKLVKLESTPEVCTIYNDDVRNKNSIILDKSWYVKLANERISKFIEYDKYIQTSF